jgi:methyltransferase
MVSGYAVLLAAVACERVCELVVSRRHARAMFARGAIERGAGHFPPMVALHVALLLGCALEPTLLDRPFLPWLGYPMLALVIAAQAVRWWAIASLGTRWNTRVIVLPGAPRIVKGPYRFLSHPNYVAVVVEGIALPLVHTAWLTALGFTILNAFVLAVRIETEDAALDAAEAAA